MNRQQLELLIEAKIITGGQAKELQRLFKQIDTAVAQVNKLSAAEKRLANQVVQSNKEIIASTDAVNNARAKSKNRLRELDASIKTTTIAQRGWKKELVATEAAIKKNAATLMAVKKKVDAGEKEILRTKMALSKAQKTNADLARKLGNRLGGLVTRQNRYNAELKKTSNVIKRTNAQLSAYAKTLESKIGNANRRILITEKLLNRARLRGGNEVDKLTRKLATLKEQQRSLNTALKDTRSSLNKNQKSIVKSQKEIEKFSRSVLKAGKRIKAFGATSKGIFTTTLRTIRRVITTMITLSALFFFRNLIKQGAEFENVMIRVGAITNATAKQFKNLVGTIRDVAKQTIFTASEVSSATQVFAQAGFTIDEILKSILPVLKLTTATMGELKQTTELVASILRVFNMSADETTDVVNILAEATVSSRADIERLATAFRFAGPAGAAFGQSLETTIASISRFIDIGLSASIAGTTFRRALIQLSQGTDKQVAVLDDLNVRLEQVDPALNDFGKILKTLARTSITSGNAIKLFGARAGASVFALIKRMREGASSIIEFTEKLGDAKALNRVDRIYKKVLTSLRSEFLITRAEMEDMALSLFQVFRPALVDVVIGLREQFQQFNDVLKSATGKDFSEFLKNDIAPALAEVAKGVTQIISIFGLFISIIIKIISAIDYFGLILKSIVGLLGIFALKALLLNRLTIGLVLAFWKFGKIGVKTVAIMSLLRKGTFKLNNAIRLTSRGVFLMGNAFAWARIGLYAFQAAMGMIAIPIAIFTLSLIMKGIISLFSKATKSGKEYGDALGEIGEIAGFTSEEISSISEQLKIQIDSEKELIQLIERRRAIVAGPVGGKKAFAVELPRFQTLLGLDKTIDKTPFISSMDQMLKTLANMIEERSNFINNELRSLIFISNENIKLAKVQADKAIGEITKSINKGSEGIKNLMKAGLTSGIEESVMGARRIVVSLLDAVSEEIRKGKNLEEAFQPILKGMEEVAVKAKSIQTASLVSAGVGLAGGLISGLPSLPEIKLGIDVKTVEGLKTLRAFVQGLGLDMDKIDKDLLPLIAENVSSVINELLKAGKPIEDLFKAAAQALLPGSVQLLERLAEQEVVVKRTREEILNFLREMKKSDDLLIDNRKTILAFTKLESVSLNNLKKIRDDLVNTIKQETGFSKILYENKLRQLDTTIKEEKAFARILTTLNLIIANTELARAKEVLARRILYLREQKEKNINDLMADRKNLLALSKKQSNGVLSSTSLFMDTLIDINKQLNISQKNIGFKKIVADVKQANREIELIVFYENAVLDAVRKVNKIEAKRNKLKFEQGELSREAARKDAEALGDAIALQKTAENNAKAAGVSLDVKKNANKVLSINIKKQESINELQKSQAAIAVQIQKEWISINASADIAKFEEVKQTYAETEEILKDSIEAAKEMDIITTDAEKVLKKTVNVRKQHLRLLMDEMEMQSKLREANFFGLTNAGKRLKVEKEIEEHRKRAEGLIAQREAAMELEGAFSDTVQRFDDMIARENDIQAGLEDIAAGGLRQVNAELEIMRRSFIDSADNAALLVNYVKGNINAFKQAAKAVSDFAIDEFIIEPIFKFNKDELQDQVKEIEDKFIDKIAEIWAEFRKAMLEAEREHQKNLNDIRIRFDDMRRERELEIYNERVERLMSLAALEQELRWQGLTDEEQRSQLLTEIDQNLAMSRIGTIEERQIKLSEIEAQVKALNQLENSLGLTRSQIEASSLARLGQLRQATSEFYDDKRTQAITSIEAERSREIEAEANRHKEMQDRLRRERDEALLKAQQAKQDALNEVKIEDEKNERLKRIQADFVAAIVREMVAAIAVKMAAGVASVFAETGVLFPVVIGGILAAVGTSIAAAKASARYEGGPVGEQKRKLGGAIALAPTMFFGNLDRPRVLLATDNLKDDVEAFNSIVARRQMPKFQKRIAGGMINGGRGGIDDIHTAMPVGAYIVNKSSTRLHRAELDMMALQGNSSVKAAQNAPVAVTAGEYAMFPPVSINQRNRLEQINSEKTTPRDLGHLSGGRGYQFGGTVDGIGVGGTGTTINNVSAGVTFAGTNIITGDESEITDLYQSGIRKLIQQDMDNKELNS